MKFVVDEQLPPALARWIGRQPDCTAAHIFAHGLRSKPDDLICDVIAREAAVLVTKDDDFVIRLGSRVDRILWVRCGNIVNSKLLALFETNWQRALSELDHRSLVQIS